ncbi:unnamed protein product [Adineta ricciae]|uniref:Uncharacterized protein n=1 Tax=Adineta ricciae TaxID=249248 RepID=A0A815Q136_ADIRI|nr:unnamed protein product [Adineta ricciae]CAF1455704.1 unnamed protein product [Adineta ricciae]
MKFFDLHEPEDGKDRFFLYAMIILPFIGSGSYLFDAWYYYLHYSDQRSYCGLLSTILIIFSYLQYAAPIRSRRTRAIYHILLFLVNEGAILGYLCASIKQHTTFKIIIYSFFLLIEIYFIIGLLYCRVYNDSEFNIIVENKHLFHFMSRLEVILTIFIPMYLNFKYESFTRNTIAYFLLFDFFSDSYSRFQGIWIKLTLYLFVTAVTVSVASEWFYFNDHQHVYEQISFIAEILSAFLCDTIIILQFFPFHFKTRHVMSIARQALDFHNDVYKNTIKHHPVVLNNLVLTNQCTLSNNKLNKMNSESHSIIEVFC